MCWNSKNLIAPHFLDASAAVKLVSYNEPESEKLRQYFVHRANWYMTRECIIETLGVLKVKWLYRKEITKDLYFYFAKEFFSYFHNDRIEIEKMELLDKEVFDEVKEIADKHSLDLSDALQILSLMKGRLSIYADASQTIFVTADNDLALAAEKEGLRVWNCIDGSEPPDQ